MRGHSKRSWPRFIYPMTEQTIDGRDLLIRLDTKMDALQASFTEMKAAVNSKAEAERVKDLETRVEKLDERQREGSKKLYMICGGITALELILKVLAK